MPPQENDPREEVRLIASVANGDRAAFRELYSRHSAALFSLAIRLLGDRGAAEEALQDTFMKIWSHAGDYDARKSRPFTWAVTLLRHTCIDFLRKRRRRPVAIPLPEDESAPVEFFTPETARRTTENLDDTRQVRDKLAALAPPFRTALELALFSTLTREEIAEHLAQPVGTIKTWIRRGLLDLRETLKDPAP